MSEYYHYIAPEDYIPAEQRMELSRITRNDIYNPKMQKLVMKIAVSEIEDDTKGMSKAERFIYLRKRLAREEREMKKLLALYERLKTRAAEQNRYNT